MKTISWGQRSEFLTRLHEIQEVIRKVLQSESLTLRDLAQLEAGILSLEEIVKIKNSSEPIYILIETMGCTQIDGTIRAWQQIFDAISMEQISETILVLKQLNKQEIPEKIAIITANLTLQSLSFDLAHEVND